MARSQHIIAIFTIFICFHFALGQDKAVDSLVYSAPTPYYIEPLAGASYTSPWLYHPGDDTAWSSPDLDESSWIEADPYEIGKELNQDKWPGIGWFRRHIKISDRLRDKLVGMIFRQMGASDIYIDGELIYRFGNVSADPEKQVSQGRWMQPVLPVIFKDSTNHVLAVRYSNHRMEIGGSFYELTDGFEVQFSDFLKASNQYWEIQNRTTSQQMFFSGVALAFALLHFLLFMFLPKQRQNLYFSILTFFMALLTYFAFRVFKINDLNVYLTNYWFFKIGVLGVSMAGLHFIYSLFHHKLPLQYWFFAGASVILLVFSQNLTHEPFYYLGLASFVEESRVVFSAVRRRQSGSWIIALGFFIMVIGVTYQILGDLGFIPLNYVIYNIYLWGFIGMICAMSIYLAREYGIIHINLALQLERIKSLSARAIEQERDAKEKEIERLRLTEENKRRESELEEMRKRQEVLAKLEKANGELQQAYQELRDTQSHLVQSEKMASLGMLVAGVAHEINTPVGAINSSHNTVIRAIDKLKEAILEVCYQPENQQRFDKLLKIIDDANTVISSGSDRVTNIVRRLRSFARLDEAEVKKVNIHEGLEDTLTIVHHELKHKAEVIKEYGDIPQIACYPSRLNQVYLNILMNAIQAMGEKGTITLRTFLENGKVHIQITDTGSGMTPDVISRIFDPGFTTKGVGVGTGLGLSICYQIIQDHRGEIKVQSEFGKGSTFTIILPTNLDEILGV